MGGRNLVRVRNIVVATILNDSGRLGRVEIVTLACENIRFSSLFADGNVSRVPPRETSPAAKREEKRMISQAIVQ